MATHSGTARLGEFLRAHRAGVRPEAHGIPSGTRRTPGLRREEVALLAGVSTDYYVRLEQGRERHPSQQVLDALATALLLEAEAAEYLRGLAADGTSRRGPGGGAEAAAPGLVGLMNAWPDTPALMYGRYMDLLAANDLGRALFSWLGDETNLLRAIFLDPEARTFYRDWARIAEGCVAAVRAENADPDDERLLDLVGHLSQHSVDFARLWARRTFARRPPRSSTSGTDSSARSHCGSRTSPSPAHPVNTWSSTTRTPVAPSHERSLCSGPDAAAARPPDRFPTRPRWVQHGHPGLPGRS